MNDFDNAMGAQKVVNVEDQIVETAPISETDAPADEIDNKPEVKNFAPVITEEETLPEQPIVPSNVPQERAPMNHDVHVAREAPTLGLNLTAEAAETKKKLDKERRLSIMVPLDFGEKHGATKIVNINGYQLEILKNVYVEVPESVANLIMNSNRQSVQNRTNHPRNVNNLDERSKYAIGA